MSWEATVYPDPEELTQALAEGEEAKQRKIERLQTNLELSRHAVDMLRQKMKPLNDELQQLAKEQAHDRLLLDYLPRCFLHEGTVLHLRVSEDRHGVAYMLEKPTQGDRRTVTIRKVAFKQAGCADGYEVHIAWQPGGYYRLTTCKTYEDGLKLGKEILVREDFRRYVSVGKARDLLGLRDYVETKEGVPAELVTIVLSLKGKETWGRPAKIKYVLATYKSSTGNDARFISMKNTDGFDYEVELLVTKEDCT